MNVPVGFAEDARNRTLVGATTLPGATEFLNAKVRLPQDIPVEYILCDKANAFWDPRNKTIQICHQLGSFLLTHVEAHLAVAAADEYASDADFEADVLTITLDAVRFVFYHEVGHAIIQLYNLPITGREEDVADQFATWMLLRDDGPNPGRLPHDLTAGEAAALSGAVGFVAFEHAKFGTSAQTINWAQSHSFDLQRAFNIACWTYGSDPVRLSWLAQPPSQPGRLYVPPDREPRCEHEHDRIDYAFKTLLGE